MNRDIKTITKESPIRAGIFPTLAGAEQAVAGLKQAGFSNDQITVLCSDQAREQHFKEFEHQHPAGTFTPGAALTGGAIGASLGGLTILAGVLTGGGAILLAAGGLAAWTGGVVGGLIGAMMTRGVEKELANFYDQALTAGKILVAAQDDGPDHEAHLAEAARVLEAAGAESMALPEG